MDRTPVIVGTGLSDYPKAPHLDGVQHHVQAMQRALADSGVDVRVVTRLHGLATEFRTLRIPRDPACRLCGAQATIHDLSEHGR